MSDERRTKRLFKKAALRHAERGCARCGSRTAPSTATIEPALGRDYQVVCDACENGTDVVIAIGLSCSRSGKAVAS